MGYRIEVNHSILKNTANQIDKYIEVINEYMKKSNSEVYDLTSKDWKKIDAITFRNKWMELSSQDSVTEHMKSALRNYANSLRYAEEQYKKAQYKSVMEANLLKIL